MASFFLTQPPISSTAISKTSLYPSFYNNSPTPNTSANGKINKALSCRSSKFSCMARWEGRDHDQRNPNTNHSTDQDQPSLQAGKLARRNVLLGLGGLYGINGLRSEHPFAAIADPVLQPDISDCQPVDIKGETLNCCPPKPTIIDYLPPPVTCLRVRQPAHTVSCEYIAKYKAATQLMKNLPSSDPRSFMQQANVHCAYCDGAYRQAGLHEKIPFLVHSSWLFFPFHRWYLYFYERILGSLIGDPTFALPFWNWDHEDGMQIPDMYTDKSSALYDEKRSTAHQPPATVDLYYHKGKHPQPRKKLVKDNYCIMYRSMVSGAKKPSLFFGSPYRQGTKSKDTWPGTIEVCPHNHVHDWTGSESTPLGEDMGVLYSAGRDPIFFAHHGNVDRMWNLWKDKVDGPNRKDIMHRDFLDAGFVFYDENARLVRVKIKDCLDTEKLGYVYKTVDLPWLNEKPKPNRSAGERISDVKQVALTELPITLTGSAVTAPVKRPKMLRSKAEEEEEVLVIEGIGFDRMLPVKFDVYVNDETDPGPNSSEYAGCFSNLPQITHGEGHHTISLRLGITDLLEDIGATEDDEIKVTLVPRDNYKVAIDGIKIELLS